MRVNKEALLDWGRKAAEASVERVLTLAENVENVARHAADRYNRLAETAPVKLPRIPLEVVPAPETGAPAESTTTLPTQGPVEVSVASIPVSAPRTAPAAEAPAPKVVAPAAKPEKAPAPAGRKPRKVPGRTVLRRWKRDEVVALCAERGVPVVEADTKAMLIGKLHGDIAVAEDAEPESDPTRLPQRATLMKRNREFVERLASKHGVAVAAEATKRQIIDQLFAATGVEG